MVAGAGRADVQKLGTDFASRRVDVRERFGGLDHESFNWQPTPTAWSVAQCLEHLNRVGTQWLAHLGPLLIRSMNEGVGHEVPYQPGRLSQRIIRSMGENGPSAKAPAVFRPAVVSDYELRDQIAAFDALGEGWEATLRRAGLIDLGKVWTGSPAAGFMRFPLGVWLCALSNHEARHLSQARHVMGRADFPR